MTKTELKGALRNILNSFIYGMTLTRLVPPDAFASLAGRKAIFGGPDGQQLSVELEPLSKGMSSPSDRKIVNEEFENCLKRALLSEGHEVVLWYCEETNQLPIYQAEPWFNFARIMRDTVSHRQGGILRGWSREWKREGITQVSWRRRTLNNMMVGTEIRFTHLEALQLFKDIQDFVEHKLA